ncbi:MAG: FAD-binding protein [Nevskiales bacterium]
MQSKPDTQASARSDGSLPIEAPLVVESTSTSNWDERCDVLVIGLGAAGAAAALAAHESGASVIVVERFDGGGATVKSGGVVYLGGGTRYQKQAGYEDTPEEMFRYLRQEAGDAVSEPTLRRFCDGSLEMLDWLEASGVEFQSYEKPPKTSYPRNGIYLYYSGSEAAPAFAAQAKPAPRGHRVKAPGIDSGRALYHALRARIEKLGIPILRQSAARRLITAAESGAVLGAEVWRLPSASPIALKHQKLMRRAETWHNFAPGRADRLRAEALALELREAKPLRILARQAVILATGGFIFNREMLAQYAPKYLPAMRLGATGCDGSGIRLGASVGGALKRMDAGSAWRFINPPTAWPTGIAVNLQGKRFCNEQVYGARLGVEMVEHNGGKAWLILDRKQRSAAIREALSGKLWFFQSVPALILMLFAPRAPSLDQLAAKLGLPSASLKETVERYSLDARSGAADELGKANEMRAPLDTPPYYALNISVDSKAFPCPTITLGGLSVDEASGAVLSAAGMPIAGLYAAGRCAVGVASNRYVSGLSLADCLFSGRRAGAQAAAQRTAAAAIRNIA